MCFRMKTLPERLIDPSDTSTKPLTTAAVGGKNVSFFMSCH